MNVMTIFYEYRNPAKFFELMKIINESKVRLRWDNKNSIFKIIWDWPQKEDVINLLPFLKETFLGAKIRLENDIEGEEELSKDNSIKIELVEKEALEPAMNIAEKNSEILPETMKNDVSEDLTDEVVRDELTVVEISEKETEEKKTSCEEETPSAKVETFEEPISVCDNDVNLESSEKEVESATYIEDDVKVETTKEAILTSDDKITCEDGENKVEEKSFTSLDKSIQETSKLTPSMETFEETSTDIIEKIESESIGNSNDNLVDPTHELEVLLVSYIEKYNFDEKFKESVESFCKDNGIRSEAFKRMFALSKSAPNLDLLYSGTARILKKNVALIKIDAKKTFEKWLKSVCPENKCPNANFIDFLNIFRKDGEKF